MLAYVSDIDAKSSNLVPDDIEKTVDKFPDNLAFIGEHSLWTYQEFENYANRVAHWALGNGLKRGDTLAMFIGNRLEYVAIWFGLSKVGIIPALINYQLRGKALAHCVNIADAKAVIVDTDLVKSWESATPDLAQDVQVFGAFGTTPFESFDEALAKSDAVRPSRAHREGIVAGDLLMKMFTSGTTGLPKAARVSHARGQYFMRAFVVPSNAGPNDRMMIVLPLYHATGGMCAVGIALMVGGAVIVRPKFSASSFWDEAVRFEATLFMYVGELCRFLLNSPPNPMERAHKIRCIIGNGLRPEVWEKFVKRFNIPCVIEFYGSTEGNISMMNFSGKVGAVGRIPPYLKSSSNGELIRFDVETNTEIRGPDGFAIRTKPGEIGELIGEIRSDESRFNYDGYESKDATQKKILHDVFKKGDRWFRTGDLLWRDKDGYYYFADRIGDTYRWKAENVATNEVADALSRFDGVEQANVYGVPIPGHDGKAGMASLVVRPKLNLDALNKHIHAALPPYARPIFLRLSHETDTTGTFKYKKTDLVKQGFDPDLVKDALYMDDPEQGKYIPLTKQVFEDIKKGKYRF